MRLARALLVAQLGAAAAGVSSVAACSEDEAGGPSASLPGSWNATSLVVQGQDLIALGMDLTLTLGGSGTYVLTVTGDLTGVCGAASSCNETGAYTFTATRITLNPGTADELSFNYVLQGSTLAFTGVILDNPATITFVRA